MEAPYLAVARFSKPHGLKGEALVHVLTDRPEAIFAPGRLLTPIDDDGRPCGAPLTLERGRRHQRRWLLRFEGVHERATIDGWHDVALGVPRAELAGPADGEMYVHEIAGSIVVAGDRTVGVARELLDVSGGQVLVVDREGGKGEVLIPFRKPILVRLDRARRRIEVDPPPGLLDL
ncbi:MAG: 16S rRNA processing protein RimM [Gemmatimonadetes bacterium]|nr:16S rRNA processing protein RimM [Gemmatimonadota bacterium]